MGRSKNIWRNYFTYCESSFVERGGTVACGVLPSLSLYESFPYRAKPETTGEHMGRAAFLLGQVFMNYPDIVKPEERFEHIMFVLCHDVGEYQNGDILDDGSTFNNEVLAVMRTEEMEIMDDFFCNFPDRYGLKMVEILPQFESYTGGAPLLDKMVEKLDAILFQLFLYTKGVVGDIKKKKPRPSGRDLRFAEIVGTTKALEVWAFHYRVATKDAPEVYQKPLRKILETAFKETYGYLPSCMTIDVTDVPLNDPSDVAA